MSGWWIALICVVGYLVMIPITARVMVVFDDWMSIGADWSDEKEKKSIGGFSLIWPVTLFILLLFSVQPAMSALTLSIGNFATRKPTRAALRKAREAEDAARIKELEWIVEELNEVAR